MNNNSSNSNNNNNNNNSNNDNLFKVHKVCYTKNKRR